MQANTTPDNAKFFIKKVLENKTDGDIVMCGVFKGGGFFPIADAISERKLDKRLIGFDSFSGFPEGILTEYDNPAYFEVLLKNKEITLDHFEKAKLRTGGFKNSSHLQAEYFSDTEGVFERAKEYSFVKLIKGDFNETLPAYKGKIAVLIIDCDLYESYKICLKNLLPKVSKGGVVIFDEYYSHKYPGARVAVNEVFSKEELKYEVSENGFERWYVNR